MSDAAPGRHEIMFELDGDPVECTVPAGQTLIELVREDLRRTGTTEGCGVGVCGCCTVLVDGRTVSSCLELAVNVDGATVETVEGLADEDGLHPLQEAFQDYEGFQCGYCTPGMLTSAAALLREHPDPSRDQITTYLSENLCRCTGYKGIVRAVEAAAAGEYDD